VNPDASETCNGVDDDCSGSVDDDASDASTFYADSDATVFPDAGGCAQGTSCADILDSGGSSGDGTYTIDPDGAGTGVDPFDVTCDMTSDGCAQNGGEGGDSSLATTFEIRSVLVPLINVQARDAGDSGEQYGSPLTDNPAWLR